ncbi:MAG TPA: type II secretion system protein [Candidatus Izemoplasmatales bacterium]|nr:type II secretion system protein [Bacillota bacterium]HRY78529.1 type II secretion system protein [Candidatus Izemoplasmatales bacterium]
MNKKHRGVTLPELLGAIVILGLVTSLLGTVAYAMIRGIDRISVNQTAETTGLALVRYLEKTMEDSHPNTYSTTCEPAGGCIVLIQEYTYVYDAVTGSISPLVHPTPLETEIAVHSTGILVNGVPLEMGSFTLSPTSTLVVSSTPTRTTVTFSFALVAADGRSFPFTAVFSFTTSTIPA